MTHLHLSPAVVTGTSEGRIVQYAADQRGALKRVWCADSVEVTLWRHIPRRPDFRGTVRETAAGWQAHDPHGTCIAADADSNRAAETALLRLLAAEHGKHADAATFDEPLSSTERAVIAGLRQAPEPLPERDEAVVDMPLNPRPVDPDRYHARMAANMAYSRTLHTSALCDTWEQSAGTGPDRHRSRNLMARESIIDELVARHPDADQAFQDAMSSSHDHDTAERVLIDVARAAA